MIAILMKFWPAFMAVVVSILNAIEPQIGQFIADHPDIAINVSSLLTTIANAINPRLNQPTIPPAQESA